MKVEIESNQFKFKSLENGIDVLDFTKKGGY